MNTTTSQFTIHNAQFTMRKKCLRGTFFCIFLAYVRKKQYLCIRKGLSNLCCRLPT